MYKSPIILFFTTLVSFASFCQIKIVSKFKRTKIPVLGSSEWYFLNASNLEYQVKNVIGKLEIKIDDNFSNAEFDLTDGKLIGTSYSGNKELFYFKPFDTSSKEVVIKKGNVLFIFKYKRQIYFIESLEIGSYRKGELFRLVKTGNNFECTKILEFKNNPLAFAINKDRLYIATDRDFLIVENLKETMIFENTFWESLYPNSIAYFNDKNIFIGIRSGIVKLDILEKRIEFYQSEDN